MSENQFVSLIDKHLRLNKIFNKNPLWVVKSVSSHIGRGLFADRDIQPGEIIFTDVPLLIGPRASKVNLGFCVNCFAPTTIFCSNDCSLPVCSKKCELAEVHVNECLLIKQWKLRKNNNLNLEIVRCLTPIRSFFLNKYQKKLLIYLMHNVKAQNPEIEIFKKFNVELTEEEEILFNLACSVFDVNAFELLVGNDEKFSIRALYPLASLVNHSCVPNCANYFDSKQKMTVKANKFIPKGKELFFCYTKLFWSTFLRRPYLFKTKQFVCNCERCNDSSEFNTNLGAINCLSCKSVVNPNGKNFKISWVCDSCNKITSFDDVRIIFTMIGGRVDSFEENPEKMIRFLKDDFVKFFPVCNYLAIEIKLKLVWILGYKKNYLWKNISDELLNEKETICRDLLQVLNMLSAGKCKMRGLLLYELYACLKERQKRLNITNSESVQENNLNQSFEEMDNLFEEAKEILMHDVHAPQEIKNCIK